MSSRPYAAVMMLDNKIFMMDVMAPLRSDEAKNVLEEMYPGHQLLALIPGTHTNYSYIYNNEIGERGCTQSVDPFDMPFMNKQSA